MIPHSQPSFGAEEAQAAAEAVLSGWVKAGPRCTALEQEMADFFGARGSVAMASGTLAIAACLIGLGLGPGDEVAIPSYCCRALWDAVRIAGAEPLLCDSNPEHCGLDPDDLAQRRTARTAAVIQAHQFGFLAPLEHHAFSGLAVIEDMCQRIADAPHRSNAAHCAAQVCSFEATKPIACGEGGIAITSDEVLLHRLQEMADKSYDTQLPGISSRLSDLQAAVVLVQWRRYPEFLRARRLVADKYAQAFPKGNTYGQFNFRPHDANFAESSIPFRWVGWVYDAEYVCRYAQERGCGVKRPVKPYCLHQWLGFPDEEFPGATALARRLVSLPIYPSIQLCEIDQIIAVFTER